MTPKIRSVGRGPAGRRYLSSDRELRLGVCFWFRLFNVVPETTARFSYLDDRSRNQSPPCLGCRPLWPACPFYGFRLGPFDGRAGRAYPPLQRPISLLARAASRSASRAMITLRLS